ncbi:hypothetical protein [Fibrobacter intestinalis]|uniref:hypothetical protein n=1 Tax=Fibrobacter intestinalis TaxID=28122 RepID=UPI0023F00037|nr:hypothetical protein [Fibrobacter intestinalis]MDD7300284.1 hypothetical protein [Fibrobacter intestinalis]
MKKILSILALALPVFALDVQAVFDNQKKSAFPDTCELLMRTTVSLPGQGAQTVETSVLNKGKDKSVTIVKSSAIQMKIVQNGNRTRITDLKSGKVLPAQNMPSQNPADISAQLGNPGDYRSPVKEGSLWKIVSKEDSKPTLYYSAKSKRIVRMSLPVNGAEARTALEYCDNSCPLPGTLNRATIVTKLASGDSSTVVVEILKAKGRSDFPESLFDVK